MKQSETNAKSSKVLHRILTAIGVLLCIILIPMLVINVTLIVKNYTNPDKVPSVGGLVPMVVMTDSMVPEIQSGDLIICRTAEVTEVKVGDIITFFDPAGNGTSVVTHRVKELSEKDGAVAWKTQGDANNTEDRELVPAKNLIGVYLIRIPGAGNVALFMRTTPGLLICVILPIVLLVAYDLIRRRSYEKAQKKDTEALMKELEELRAKSNETQPSEEEQSTNE